MRIQRKTILFILAITGILVVPFIYIFRGIDVTDTGFLLTNQRFIFSAPESVSYWFHLWLTNIIGGLIDLAWGQRFGILPHRLASVAIFWCTALCVYRLYKNTIDKNLIAFGILFGSVFSFIDKVNIVHYNNLSALFFFMSSLCLLRAISSGNKRFFFLGGCIASLNIFVRFPNLLGIGIILIPFIYNFVFGKTKKKVAIRISDFLAYIAGCAFACVCVLAVMKLLGHLDIYIASLKELSDIGKVGQDKYSSLYVLLRPVRDTGLSLIFGFLVFLILTKSKKIRIKIPSLVIYPVCLIFAFFAYKYFAPRLLLSRYDRIYLWVTAGIGYVSIIYLFMLNESTELLLAGILGVVNVLLLNIGSDTAIRVSMFAFLAVFPLFFYILKKITDKGKHYSTILFAGILISIYIGFALFTFGHSFYRDKNTVVMPTQKQLQGLYTSPRSAALLDEMTAAVNLVAKKNDYVYIHDSIPLLHFLTNTRPYVNNPWPVIYNPDYLALMLEEARKTHGDVPFILVKQNPRSENWPDANVEPYNTDIVLRFLEKNNYFIYKDTQDYVIYLPAKSGETK